MKRILLLAFTLFLLAGLGNAQASSSSPLTTYPMPYFQGFNSTTIPTDWTTQLVTATCDKFSYVASATLQTAAPQEGSDFVMFNSYYSTCGGSGAEERLISPGIVTTGQSSVDLQFYWFQSGNTTYTNPAEGVQVEWSPDATTWTSSTFYPRYVSTANTNGEWAKKTITLPSGAGNIPTLYISFKFHSAYGYNCYLDNMIVLASPTCIEPSALTTSNITANSATLSWTASVTPPANGYDIYFSTSSTPPTSGTTPSGSVGAGVTTYNMTGLNSSSTYYAWVRSVCSSIDKSIWGGPKSFNTLCGVLALPWSENFDAMGSIGNNIVPNCWKAESPSGTPWSSGNAASITYNDPCSAPNYVYVNWSPYGPTTYKCLITPGFYLYSGVSYSFSFNWVGDTYAGWTGDVCYNTSQTGTGATVIGTNFVDPGMATTTTCSQVTRTFVPASTDTFYLMVRILNTITPYDMGFDDFTMTPPPCNAPSSLTAANVTTSDADLGWTSAGTAWEYQYGPAGYTPTATGTATSSNPTHVAGLSAGTAYDFYVRNNCQYGFSTWAGPMTFTTLAAPPTVVTNAAAPVAGTTATLNGTVTANGASTAVTFEYGLTTGYGTNVNGVPGTVNGSTPANCTAGLTGLTPNTMYHFRIKGVNSQGTSLGFDMTFTTSAIPPVVVTNAATLVNQTMAQLNGTITANNASSTVSFQYGLTTTYGTTVAGVPPTVTGTTATTSLAALTGLTPSTLYHFRCVAVNSGGTTNGSDLTFTTPAPTVPTITTNAVLMYNLTTATLNGTATANGANTTLSFEYGLTTTYGLTAAGVPATATGNTSTSFSADLTGLTPHNTYHYRAKGVNSVGTTYGTDMTFQTECPIAGPAGPISGPANVCLGGCGYVYSVTIPGATGYAWTLPIGASITNGANTNTITVCFAANSIPGYLFVYGTAPCGNGAPSSLAISIGTPATPTISGPLNACINSTGNVYTTQTGMTGYVWNVATGGNITAGGTSTSSSVTVTWTQTGAKTVSVNYNSAGGCPGLNPAVANVTVNALPVPAITGPTPACTNYPTDYSTEAGNTGYSWTVTGGVINSGQGTGTVNVTWTTTGSKTICVNYISPSGCTATTPTCKTVTVNAGPAPTITGLTNVCVNSGYITYSTQTGMTGYVWTVSPGGVINYGAGTASIMVTWNSAGAQWVKVSYTNAAGCSPYQPTQLNVTVTGTPGNAGTIYGEAEVCAGSTGVPYSVLPIANASVYIWNLPSGATIASGAGTNSITVDYATNAYPGDITVYGNNVCGNGTVSPPFSITISPVPGAAGTIIGLTEICKPALGIAYYIDEVTGATSYDWTLPTGATIASGASTNSITVDFDATAEAGVISVAGMNDCGPGNPSPDLTITVNPTPPAPTISQSGNLLTSDATTGNQWYKDDFPIPGATEQTYTALVDGEYWVVVTVNGCPAESNHISVIVGIRDLHGTSISIRPVPNDGHFTVSIAAPSQQNFSLVIYNNMGMKVYEEENIVVNSSVDKVIDLSAASQGIYSVVLQGVKSHLEKKIVITR